MIPFSSAIERTIKFGAFPIYVFAPINTAPDEIAIRRIFGTNPPVTCIPSLKPSESAVLKNTRYVGVLSRKLDKNPVIQKNCQGFVTPSSPPFTSRIRSVGIIVINIPMKSIATSSIASHVKWLSSLMPLSVVLYESNAAASIMITSRSDA